MHALWAFVVVCLMAAHGVPSARAAMRGGEPGEREMRVDHPGLPAIVAARSEGVLIATPARTQASTWAIAAKKPVLRRFTRMRLIEAPPHTPHTHSVLVTTRSARGPPGR